MDECNQPKVSVIIPFYSHKDWLKESLESVFSQTYKDLEVILVNDGSKEDIEDVIEPFKDKIIYLQQENKGPGAARNLGIRYAKGKYIAFEDADDIWLPQKLEIQIPFMESRGIIWSHTGFYYWWPQTNRLKSCNVMRGYGDTRLQRYISVKMATPTVVVEKDFLEKNNICFPENIRNGEDGRLFSLIAEKEMLGLVVEPLAKIRQRGTNSSSHAIERFRLGAKVYENLKKDRGICPRFVVFIKWIYYVYSKIFRGEITPFKEFLAKCFWVLPYSIERIYVQYLSKISKKEEKYILRQDNN